MKRIAITLIVLLAACDAPEPPAPTGKEEAGQVALGCLAAMAECEDWAPIEVPEGRTPMKMPNCEDYASDCRSSRRAVEKYNHELENAPKMRSQCQQRIDSCVDLVRALMPTVTEINHNHGR